MVGGEGRGFVSTKSLEFGPAHVANFFKVEFFRVFMNILGFIFMFFVVIIARGKNFQK